jgi:hypothetical protein
VTRIGATGKYVRGKDESTDIGGYINNLLIYSPIFFPLVIFQSSWRSIDEPSDAAIQSGDRAGAAPLEAVSARVVEGRPGGM